MKIKIDDTNIENLKKIKDNIEKLLQVYSKDMEFTEENVKRVKEAVDKVNASGKYQFQYGNTRAKIVNSDGTEFTIV